MDNILKTQLEAITRISGYGHNNGKMSASIVMSVKGYQLVLQVWLQILFAPLYGATYYILGAHDCTKHILKLRLSRAGGGEVQPLWAWEITEIWIESASVILDYQVVLSTVTGILKTE